MAAYRFAGRIVRTDGEGNVVWIGPKGSGHRALQPAPPALRAQLRPHGWESEAIEALERDKQGDPTAVVDFAASRPVRRAS